jgi:hypothetical protein
VSARRRRNKKQFVNPNDLAPGLREGLTQDVSIEEIRRNDKGSIPGGLKAAQHMNKETGGRVPNPHFVAQQTDTGFVRQATDGRKMVDAHLTFTNEVFNAIRGGMMCLKCLEPQASANADEHMPGCEGVLVHGPRYMRDFFQVQDIALEFEGETHIGPSKPMSEILAERDLERQKRDFQQKILEGKSRGRNARAT